MLDKTPPARGRYRKYPWREMYEGILVSFTLPSSVDPSSPRTGGKHYLLSQEDEELTVEVCKVEEGWRVRFVELEEVT